MEELTLVGEEVARLDEVDQAAPGSLFLRATDLGVAEMERLLEFVAKRGEALGGLMTRTTGVYSLSGFQVIDFAVACPVLRSIDVDSLVVGPSLFQHPTLEKIKIDRCDYRGPDIEIGPGVRDVEISDCQIHAGAVLVGPESGLVRFWFSLDEDYADYYPNRFEFRECPELTSISVVTETSPDVVLDGVLPNLKKLFLRKGQYGECALKIVNVEAEQRARYRRMRKTRW